MFYPQAEIIKIVSPSGRRLGGILRQTGHPDILLTPRDIQLLGDTLYNNGRDLNNASITVDGRIRSKTGRTVKANEMDEATFRRLYRPIQMGREGINHRADSRASAEALKQPQCPTTYKPAQTQGYGGVGSDLCKAENTGGSAQQEAPRLQGLLSETSEIRNKGKPAYRILDRFNKYSVKPNPTEIRLGSLIEEGIRLADEAGIKVRVTHIETKSTKESKNLPYMIVSAKCNQLKPRYTGEIKFSARLNGKVVLSVWEDNQEAPPSIDDIYSMFEETTQNETLVQTQCKTSSDIYALLHYYAIHSKSLPDDMNLKAKAEQLIRESHNEMNLDKIYVPVTYEYPHSKVGCDLTSHIHSLEQLRAVLNARFTGTYSFIWTIKNTTAVLSVVGYDSIRKRQSLIEANAELKEKIIKAKVSEDAYVETAVPKLKSTSELIDDIKTESLVELHLRLIPTSLGNVVDLRHRLLRGNRLWIGLAEHRELTYVDEVCTAVEFIMDEVLRQGFIRGSITVIAHGKVENQDHYLLSDRDEAVALDQLLALREHNLVEGVAFRKKDDGGFAVLDNLDIDGETLPKFADIRGNRFIVLDYNFRDTLSDEEVTIKTALPWKDYRSFSKWSRKEQITLKEPSRMINELTVAPNKQLNTINPLADKLKTHAKNKGYTSEQTVELLQDFMLIFRYTKLMDVLRSNRTPMEMLLDRKGCCLELSLIASVILSRMGYKSSVLLRYSPALDTRYHAVSGVYLPNYVMPEDNLTEDVAGYKALELTLGRKRPIGEASYWGKPENNSGAIEGIWGIHDPKEVSQVALVELNPSMQVANTALLARNNQLIPYQTILWHNVLTWFTDKHFIPQID